MQKLFFTGLVVLAFAACNPEANKIPPCFNGIQDGKETGIDCGGPDCDSCKVTCVDQLLNGDEEGVDCGGATCNICNPAISEFSVKIDGSSFTNSVNSVDLVNKAFIISGSLNDVIVTISIPADINPGSYELPDETMEGVVSNGSVVPPLFFISDSGVITITTHDKVNKTIKGTFEFAGIASGGETIEVSNGSFRITY